MGGGAPPGPMCQVENPITIDDGTMCLAPSPLPGPIGLESLEEMDNLRPEKKEELTEHKGDVGKFTQQEINDAIKTVYGELTYPPHKATAAEARAIASTIFNRQARIGATRKSFEEANKAKQAAQKKLKEESTKLETANAEFEKLTKNETKSKKEIGETIKEKDPKKRTARINQAFAEKVQAAKDKINAAKAAVDKAGDEVKKAQKVFEKARDAKIAAESYVKESKRTTQTITLTDIVEQNSQYEGTKKGKDDFKNFSKWDKNTQKKHKERYDAATKAVLDLAQDPTRADKYIEFKGGNLRPDGALPGETQIGGNYFE